MAPNQPGPMASSTRLQVPSLGPFSQPPLPRWVRDSPTVAVKPGENWSSQNLLRKDVFPTAELPTNTILKSRSGVEGNSSSYGWQTVWPAAKMVTSPCFCHNLPFMHPYGVQGKVGTWPPHQHKRGHSASDAGSFGLRAQRLLPVSAGEKRDIHSTNICCLPTLLQALCWA